MKKMIIILSLGMFIAGATMAQNAPQKDNKARPENREVRKDKTPEERAAMQTRYLTRKLNLTALQQEQVQALNAKKAQQMEALRADKTTPAANEPRQAKGQEMKNTRSNWERELKTILTTEQYARYEAGRQDMQANHPGKGKHKGKKGNGRKAQRGHANHQHNG